LPLKKLFSEISSNELVLIFFYHFLFIVYYALAIHFPKYLGDFLVIPIFYNVFIDSCFSVYAR